MALKKQQKEFCKFKAQGFSNEESALKAGYARTTAKTKAHLWLGKSEIVAEIEKWKQKAEKKVEEEFNYSVEQSFKKLLEIQELALLPNKDGDYNNLNSAIKAEELKGKLGGCYEKNNTQQSTSITVNNNVVDDVLKKLKEL